MKEFPRVSRALTLNSTKNNDSFLTVKKQIWQLCNSFRKDIFEVETWVWRFCKSGKLQTTQNDVKVEQQYLVKKTAEKYVKLSSMFALRQIFMLWKHSISISGQKRTKNWPYLSEVFFSWATKIVAQLQHPLPSSLKFCN